MGTVDIQATGQGFEATGVEFKALTQSGKDALAAAGGGFACIGLTVRKSYVGEALNFFDQRGCKVEWVS